jgi:hypothetical protein
MVSYTLFQYQAAGKNPTVKQLLSKNISPFIIFFSCYILISRFLF